MAWGIFGLGKKEKERRAAQLAAASMEQAQAALIHNTIAVGVGPAPFASLFVPAVGGLSAANMSQQAPGTFWDRIASNLSQLSTIQGAPATPMQAAVAQTAANVEAAQQAQLQAQQPSTAGPVIVVVSVILVGLGALVFALRGGGGRRR